MPANADHFGFRASGQGFSAAGIVTSHGLDLFSIRTTAGGLQPIQRASVIAGRLETILEEHGTSLEFFTIGARNGEVILQHSEHIEHLPHILVTIDRSMASGTPGANNDRQRLAQWWLAVLRDHFHLARGESPSSTAGTPVGAAFERLYQLLGPPTGSVSSAEIRQAFLKLPAEMQRELVHSAYTIPAGYHPAAQAISPPGPAADHDGHGADGHPEADHKEPPAPDSGQVVSQGTESGHPQPVPGATTPTGDNSDKASSDEPASTTGPAIVQVPGQGGAGAASVRLVGPYRIQVQTVPTPVTPGIKGTIRVIITMRKSGSEPAEFGPLVGDDSLKLSGDGLQAAVDDTGRLWG